MVLKLYYHPLSSFCHKVLIALYENDAPFAGEIVDLGNKGAHERFFGLWPIGKMPLLHDESLERTVPGSSIIIEYLDRHYPGPCTFLPKEDAPCLEARLWDRFFDHYVQFPMQKIVTDRLRAEGEHDPRGVAEARATLETAYGMLEKHVADKTWAIGETFGLADCAAAPALFFADIVEPFASAHPMVAAYFERLLARASFKRVIAEARPYFKLFPYKDAIPARFLGADEVR
jgi:glutathione S-transferase